MEYLVLGLLMVIASAVVTWVNFFEINKLKSKMRSLESRLVAPRQSEQSAAPITVPKPIAQVPQPTPPQPSMVAVSNPISEPKRDQTPPKETISLEQQFGARLPVWIGGIALAVAGVFLVKYSIDAGFLGPTVRVSLAISFGIALLVGAHFIRNKPDFANGPRISQALSGAGIAVMYASVFAATSLYALLGPLMGFLGLATITALAVLLSLRHGMPIALLGLIGGFVTPALVSSNNPSALSLFVYIFLVTLGLMLVVRNQKWWPLGHAAVFGAFLWVCIWLLSGNFNSNDVLWLGLFITAICGTVAVLSREQFDSKVSLKFGASTLNYVTFVPGLILMGVVAARAEFVWLTWGLFALLSFGCLALAYFNPRVYRLSLWASMLVNIVMLISWQSADAKMFAAVLLLFSALYLGGGYFLQKRNKYPLPWALLVAFGSLGYYLTAYFKLSTTDLLSHIPIFWSLLACAPAALAALEVFQIFRTVKDEQWPKQYLLAIYASTSSAFVSIAFTIELPIDFLPLAIAGQVFALSVISTKIDIRALRYIGAVLAGVFCLLLSPQLITFLTPSTFNLISDFDFIFRSHSPFFTQPIFQLGIPFILFGGASSLFRKSSDDNIVRFFESGALFLLVVLTYVLVGHIFASQAGFFEDSSGLLEITIVSNLLLFYSVLCFYVGGRFNRIAVSLGGLAIAAVAVFRIGYFHLLLANPLWSHQAVGSLPIFNVLLLAYALPVAWFLISSGQVQSAYERFPILGAMEWKKFCDFLVLILAFVFVSLNVRQVFQGNYLNSTSYENAEVYAYSVVWLISGIILLLLGSFRQAKNIRIASLAVMILTIAKVFLYDARQLEGLFRVFSFLGLGLSLLALSWFYTRYAFKKHESSKDV